MTLHKFFNDTRLRFATLAQQARDAAFGNPAVAVIMLLATGVACGAGVRTGVGQVELTALQAQAAGQHGQLETTRREAQREVNALAARLGELQAEANRLNALGDRLTRIGQLETQFKTSGEQLSVLEALLFNRALDRSAMPSRSPVARSYITSGFGGRADPFGGGAAFHKGIDFDANTGDPVMAVGDGVVTYAGVRSGYGNVVEVDHGNGYVTRYAHNSRLVARVGDLVRSGQQIAKAGSTGRSTGAHVHFEVWENGRVVNPRKFLGDQGVKRG